MQRATRPLLIAGVIGVVLYVATWAILGLTLDGYDPLRQAISETFDLGAPAWSRRTLSTVLVITGVALMPFGFALDRALPGHGRAGAWLTAAAGLGTTVVAFFPCTDGCPGIGTTFTDTMHVVWAGGGYLGLVLAPVAFGLRLRGTDAGRLATAGLWLGGLATVGFLLRNVGPEVLPGLQQRVFNTAADLWLLLAAVEGLRRVRTAPGGPAAPTGAAESGQADTDVGARNANRSSTAAITP